MKNGKRNRNIELNEHCKLGRAALDQKGMRGSSRKINDESTGKENPMGLI